MTLLFRVSQLELVKLDCGSNRFILLFFSLLYIVHSALSSPPISMSPASRRRYRRSSATSHFSLPAKPRVDHSLSQVNLNIASVLFLFSPSWPGSGQCYAALIVHARPLPSPVLIWIPSRPALSPQSLLVSLLPPGM